MRKLYFLINLLLIATSISSQTDLPAKEKKYFNLTSIGIIIGTPNQYFETNAIIPSISMVNGYNINKHISVGIGAGVEIFQYTVFPIFGDIRYKFRLNEKYYPFIAFQGGYSFANNHKTITGHYNQYYEAYYTNTGGWMFSPQVGMNFSITPLLDMAISLGYRYQELDSEITSNHLYSDQVDHISTTFNRMSFNIGFYFK